MSISVWGFEGGPQETWASLAKESEDLRQWWGPQKRPPRKYYWLVVHAKEILNNTECCIWEPSQELLKGILSQITIKMIMILEFRDIKIVCIPNNRQYECD
ncbi:hypothetical protein ALC53_03742 [Atta colombica]|uniref:Uncharacterized protein n=1 Tax=Atta colombica TaxID=520822 RepID=A0A195BM15_9HYME|nr:hypothetical protein ALC53_03742 [Atta colombica]